MSLRLLYLIFLRLLNLMLLLGRSSASKDVERVCCVGGKQTRFSAVLLRSDGAGEFGEDRWEPMPLVDIHAEFVVAATEVLDETPARC
jgi:hypothetical protein